MKIFNRFLDALSVLRSVLFAQKTTFDNIDVKGSKEFCKKISSALELLREHDSKVFEVVNKSLTLIIEGRETMLSLSRWGGTLSLGEKYVNASQTWLAGVLAYKGAVSGLYLDNLKKYGNVDKMPKELGEKAWETQYECLRRLGADYEELKHLADFIETRQ